MQTCAFCGCDPYHREDVGFGGLGVAVAVTCCEAGILAYGRGPADETIEITAAELRDISAKIAGLEWQIERRERKAKKVAGIARIRLAKAQISAST